MPAVCDRNPEQAQEDTRRACRLISSLCYDRASSRSRLQLRWWFKPFRSIVFVGYSQLQLQLRMIALTLDCGEGSLELGPYSYPMATALHAISWGCSGSPCRICAGTRCRILEQVLCPVPHRRTRSPQLRSGPVSPAGAQQRRWTRLTRRSSRSACLVVR